MAAILIVDFKLREKTIRRREEVNASPCKRTAIPSVTENCADCILPVCQQIRYVVGLIKNALAVVSEIRRHHVVADRTAVQVHAVTAERSDVEPRGANRF